MAFPRRFGVCLLSGDVNEQSPSSDFGFLQRQAGLSAACGHAAPFRWVLPSPHPFSRDPLQPHPPDIGTRFHVVGCTYSAQGPSMQDSFYVCPPAMAATLKSTSGTPLNPSRCGPVLGSFQQRVRPSAERGSLGGPRGGLEEEVPCSGLPSTRGPPPPPPRW